MNQAYSSICKYPQNRAHHMHKDCKKYSFTFMNKIAKIPAKELITLTNEIAKRSVATCES